ncbi:MAG TPA: lipid A phosphate methyltransferase [Crocinitomix sp.]|nr:lipid A phosphate methyltransferase [Crocinitomix sp.]
MALQEELEQQGNWLFRHRSYLPLVVLIIGLMVYLFNKYYNEEYIFNKEPYENYLLWGSLMVSLCGFFIRVYTVGYTPKNTSGRNTKEGQVAEVLNTRGMYSVVRHPLYLGNFLLWLGPAMLTGQIWFIISFILFYWIYYERIMFAEEQFLRKIFGQKYLDWSENVPAFLPKIKNFKKNNLLFNWKKVIYKERNGFSALFIIFCTFDILGKTIQGRTDYNYYLIIVCVFALFIHILLKILKKTTRLFSE